MKKNKMKLSYVNELNAWRDKFPSNSKLFRDAYREVPLDRYDNFPDWYDAVITHFEELRKKGIWTYKESAKYVGISTERMRQLHALCLYRGGFGKGGGHKARLRGVYDLCTGRFKGLYINDVRLFKAKLDRYHERT